MSIKNRKAFGRKRLLAVAVQSALALAAISAASLVHAQDDGAAGMGQPTGPEGIMLEEIVVTGFRNSLRNAAAAKRDTVYVSDSVFSEDVGKFPDLNIAEAINRVPGIQLNRDIDGSGLNIAIRGLNTNFTKITLNGAQIAVASSGRTDSSSSNRELDLDVFPTEFFTRLDVNKSPVASMLEGGLAGTVNMRSMRPFDTTTNHISYQAQAGYGELSEQYSPRGSLLGSWKNSDNSFGILAGLAGVSNKVVTQGFETIGWTNANLTYDQCGITPPSGTQPGAPAGYECNQSGGNGFIIGNPVYRDQFGFPTSVPGYHVTPNNAIITGSSGTEYGPGSVIDNDFLLDVNPNLTTEQISSALIPRLGRPHYSEGDRDRLASLVSMEWIPTDYASFFVDVLYADADRQFNRLDMNLVGRNSRLIPTNMQVDANNVVTEADFFNAQFFLEARPYDETLEFYSVNPGVLFLFGDDMSLNLEFNTSRSEWFREAPTVGIVTRLDGGVVARYLNNQGDDAPQIVSNVDLNDPSQVVGWNWERAYIQNEERLTGTDGARLDFQMGDDYNNWKVGVAYDEISRYISAYDESYNWEQVVRGAVSAAQIPDYLVPGPAGFVTVDYDALFAATNYYDMSANAGLVATSGTSSATSDVIEETVGAYLEANREFEVYDRSLRLNGGVRYVTTDQEVGGLQLVGSAYEWRADTSDYSEVLPSFNAVYDLTENLVLRTALSRTLTRANPQDMIPVTIFTDQSAQTAFAGNADLEPFTSDNFDVGLEWYTEDEGYAAINYFQKDIEGFTYGASSTVPFSALNLPFDSLSGAQQTAINSRGGPQEAEVQLQRPQNAEGSLKLSGVELLWVQPMPWLLQGSGYTVNWTTVDQKAEGSNAPTFATNVSENIVNFTTYYENSNLTLRLSYVWYDEQIGSALGADGVFGAQRFIEPRGQWDFSGSYAFTDLPSNPKITFNLINFGSDPQREIFSYDNAPYVYYDPGYTAVLGISGTFY